MADAQVTDRIDFALPRMSAIAGRISDESGEPLEGVTVLAMRSMCFEGRRRLVPIVTTTTDDAGDYRLQKLSPASYVVMASTKETWTVICSINEAYKSRNTTLGSTRDARDAGT